MTSFITANGLMLCPFDGRMTTEVFEAMYKYLKTFHLKSAIFQCGCVTHIITRDEVVDELKKDYKNRIEKVYKRGMISYEECTKELEQLESEFAI